MEEVSVERRDTDRIRKALSRIEKSGPQSVVCFGSTRSSLENQAMLVRLCQARGWDEPRFYETPEMARKVRRAVSRLDDRLATSMRQMEKADFILVVGADPRRTKLRWRPWP